MRTGGRGLLVGLALTVTLLGALTTSCSVDHGGGAQGGGAGPATPQGSPGQTSGAAAKDRPDSTRRRCVRHADSGALTRPARLDLVRMIVSSAENSSLRWEEQYGYIEYDVEGHAAENRGYTGGIIGFTSKTHDMLLLVEAYTRARPGNRLAPYLPALRRVDGTSSRAGLGHGFVRAWKASAADPAFRATQRRLADSIYYTPAIRQAVDDGLGALGQFAYADAIIMHGPGRSADSFSGIRRAALRWATPPSSGGDERAWIDAFLDARVAAMTKEQAHSDTSRIDHAQRRWLRAGNLGLTLPLTWTVYGDHYRLDPCP